MLLDLSSVLDLGDGSSFVLLLDLSSLLDLGDGSSCVLLLDLSSLLDLGDGSSWCFVIRLVKSFVVFLFCVLRTCRLLFMLQLPLEEGVWLFKVGLLAS